MNARSSGNDYEERPAAREVARRRQELYAACAKLAEVIGGEPIEQAADALNLYERALKIALNRYGDDLMPARFSRPAKAASPAAPEKSDRPRSPDAPSARVRRVRLPSDLAGAWT
jgi:hypothetical protein